jgi:hypothetical protein
LVDDVLIHGPFILNNDRASIFINAKRINPATMGFTCGIFGGEEANSKESIQMFFNESLKRLFNFS